jgi:2-C-methyl-D-erythritol 2,4-cyclodiphosphate synthase
VGSVDLFLLAERPKLSPHMPEMRSRIAGILQIPEDAVGLQATTNEGLGFVGRGEGLAAWAVAVGAPPPARRRRASAKKGHRS